MYDIITLWYRAGERGVAGPSLLDLHSHILIQAIHDACSDDTVDYGTREQIRRGRPG